jgi:PAS domain S-box-containing protein
MMSVIKPTTENRKSIPWKLAVIFLLFSAVIILMGTYYYNSQKQLLFKEQENNLSAIASLKISQIENWRRERLGDAKVIGLDKPLIRSISVFFRSERKEVKSEIYDWMKSVRNEYDYRNVLIADTSFRVRITLTPSDTVLGGSILKDMKASLKGHALFLTDLHKSNEIPYIHLDLLIPLFDSVNRKQVPVGLAILRIDPDKILFPLIQSWPTQSKSSETLLLRKEGDSVLYLNELRHTKNTALNLKLPLSNKNLLATAAVNGVEGLAEGIDYRNVPVIGSIAKIAETPWYMVAKVDKEEILLPLQRFSIMITMVVILLILINASIFGFWIWQQRVRLYRNQLKSESSIRELEERFTTAFRMSPVSVTISSVSDNKFIDVNNTFLEDMEYKREDVIGRTAKELNIWVDKGEREWIINEISEKGKVFGKVISYKTRTGKILYGLSSMSVIKVNGEPCNLSTVVNITESRKSEEKLIESEELFRKLFENMLNGFAYCKMICEEGKPLDFIYLNVNEAFAILTGLKEVTGKKVSEAIPGIQDADPELLERYNRVASSGIPEVFETYVESLKMWFAISLYSPQRGYFVAVFDVITARKLAEEKLNESRATLQSIIDNSNSLIYLVDAEGRFLMVNQPLQKLLTPSGEQMIGQTRDAFLPKEVADLHRKNDLEVITSGKTLIFEEENIEPDGKHYYLTTKFPLFNNQNEIYAIGGLSTDITERKNIEKTLKESEERFRTLYENVTIGIYRTTVDGRILMANPALVKMLGFDSFEQLAHRNLENEGYEPDYPRSEFMKTIKKEGKISGLESAWNQRNGNTLFVRESAKAVKDAEGRMLYFDGTVEDITDRKKVEEALRESEDKFKYVFDHSLIPKSITFPSGEINVNRAFCEMLGYKPEDLKKINWADISHPDDIELTNNSLNLILSGKKDSVRFTKRYMHKNGSVVWADVGTSLRRDDNNNPQYFMTSANDITERKAAEEALLESEERFSKSFRTSPISFMIANMEDGRIIEVNDAFTRISGFPRDETIGNTTLNMKIWAHVEDREHMIDSIREGKAFLHKETMLRAKDGNIAIVLLSAQVIKLANRNCIISSIEDITERKKAEEALRESEERFRSMANSIPQLAWVAHADGFIYWYNQRWYEYTGTTPKQMEGWGWQIVHDPAVLPEVMEKWTASIASGQLFEMSFPLRGADGQFRTFLTRVYPMKDSEGKVVQWFGTNTDVETLKQAEEIINKLNEELEQKVLQRTKLLELANKELEAFSYSVSHDLRAPLRSVHGFTKILMEDYGPILDEEGMRICGIISSSASQMGELIDDLLSFSRIGRTSLNHSPIEMEKMTRVLFEGITSPAERKRIKLKIGKLHKCFGDVKLLGQVWTNLISNAIKYTSKNEVAKISVGSTSSDKMITYWIKDNGVGFDMQYAHKLFGVFQRLHSETEFEGNGVGLAIIQRIILKHGGQVWAEGEVGRGATFYFSLPVNGTPS